MNNKPTGSNHCYNKVTVHNLPQLLTKQGGTSETYDCTSQRERTMSELKDGVKCEQL